MIRSPGSSQAWSEYQKTYYSKRDRAVSPQPEFIGSSQQKVVILDASNWVGPRADGQENVRAATGRKFDRDGGVWKVEAVEAGTYSISLRRWPPESGLALTDGAPEFQSICSGKPLPAGVALPIAQASLEVDSRLHQKAIGDDPEAIRFEIELTQGPHELHGIFRDADGNALCGSFYATIEKL